MGVIDRSGKKKAGGPQIADFRGGSLLGFSHFFFLNIFHIFAKLEQILMVISLFACFSLKIKKSPEAQHGLPVPRETTKVQI